METKFPHKWPFALDVLKRQYDANSDQHLMAFQSKFFDKIGPNMELKLFGAVGYMTIEPTNVEAILSTRFEGVNSVTIIDMIPSDNSLICRFRPRLSTWCTSLLLRGRNLYARWAPLEAFSRDAAPSIRTNAVPELERVQRTRRAPCGRPLLVQWYRRPTAVFLSFHTSYHHSAYLWSTSWKPRRRRRR